MRVSASWQKLARVVVVAPPAVVRRGTTTGLMAAMATAVMAAARNAREHTAAMAVMAAVQVMTVPTDMPPTPPGWTVCRPAAALQLLSVLVGLSRLAVVANM